MMCVYTSSIHVFTWTIVTASCTALLELYIRVMFHVISYTDMQFVQKPSTVS